MATMEKGEDQLIRWLAERQPFGSSEVALGIGDDLAMLTLVDGSILVGTDMLLDGVHFDSRVHAPEAIGRKALAVALSDCAAMAVCPCAALLSVALPNSWSMNQARQLHEGAYQLARKYDCAIIGGDTNSWDKPLAIDAVILAQPHENIVPIRRSGARPGDDLFVTGRLGGSILGHHMTFEPRVAEARQLASLLGSRLHALMDLSDGLSTDAGRMADASGCGLVFESAALETVVSNAARQLAREHGRSPLDHALNDGEDFELLLAVEGGTLSAEANEVLSASTPFTRVGTVVSSRGVWLADASGRTPLPPGGWQHFR